MKKIIKGLNDLNAVFPDLAKEWNYEKNKELMPDQVHCGSSKRVWWKCEKGHEWEASIYPRTKGVGCPYCAGKKALKGVNDFATLYPDLLKEWDYKKNNELKIYPDAVLSGSPKRVFWICEKGHEYEHSVYEKTHGLGNCPYCGNRKVLQGYNDLATTHPALLKEWDYEKNTELGIEPTSIIASKNIKVWWKCEKGHEWEALIYPRTKGVGCPYCSNNIALEGDNDLTTVKPELLCLWNHEKNKDIKPTMVTRGSNKKVWWRCKRGHEWQAAISYISKGGGCPYCSNKKTLPGYNDLATKFPDIVQYWDYDKNALLPTQVLPQSNKNAWWICPKGHSYQMPIYTKTRWNYHSCPICNKYKRTSVPEKIIIYYLKKNEINIEDNYQPNWLKPKEIDIFIKDLNVGIEYDGFRYHQEIKRDLEKDILCEKNGIKLIRIREKECPDYQSSALKIKLKDSYNAQYRYIEPALYELFKILDIKTEIDVQKDFSEILKLASIGNKNNCIAVTNPEVLDEWDYDKNEKIGLSPYNVTKGTQLKAYWICEKGHSYKAAISMRTEQHTGCPYCNGRKVLQGFNDLATTNPDLIKEWDYEKNKITPDQVSGWDIKYYYWKCPKGHEYKQTITNRAKHNCNCPICSGHQTLTGVNDIKTNYPELMKEWDFEKNNKEGVYPEEETKGTSKKAWWICPQGHSYNSMIANRIKGSGCPYCSGKKVLKGFNDIATTNPEILDDWDYEKNNELGISPNNISKGSEKKVWWVCSNGHSYETIVSTKIQGGGCPYCSGQKVLAGYNDLATTNPELLQFWDYAKNAALGITPNTISKGSNKKVFWTCPNDHSYQRPVYQQVDSQGRCPICKKNRTHKNDSQLN